MTAGLHYDIAIIGGGASGVAAAFAAAKSGSRVALIESTDHLGGAVSVAMHRSLCGLYAAEPKSPLDTLNAGPQREIIAAMCASAPAEVHPRALGKSWVLEFPPAAWNAALEQACANSHIDRLMNTRVTAITRHDSRLTSIHLEGEATGLLSARVFIDCTGGGSLLQLIGDDAMLAPDTDRMLGGFSIRLANLSDGKDGGGDGGEQLRLQVPYVLSRAAAAGELAPEAKLTMFQPGPGSGEGVCKLAVHPGHFQRETIEPFARQIIAHLQCELAAFANARIVEMSPRAAARDGRRLRGRYMMTEQDVLQAHRQEGNCVRGWWPIERWDAGRGPSYAYPPIGEPYDIPLDAQRSAVIDNLLAAGICVCATANAAASIRASGICLATGAAAGTLGASMV